MPGETRDTDWNKEDPEIKKIRPKKKRKKSSKLAIFGRRLLEMALIFVIFGTVSFAIFYYPTWQKIHNETIAIADAHKNLSVTHPGWSFPGKVWSAPAPLYLSKERKIAHAKYRKYTQACPPKNPGEYCQRTGEVVPRGGFFPDGVQPGKDGWSRQTAMEPVLLQRFKARAD